ncbi:unnamed protein product [Rhizoctonia solani]|uniref:Uncharacterized protein n=1 Tax=Rhizoctonia solani TaxID=456999 RepID=A0A8H3HQ78_9AGAM|nr:unnamed protein product [Rhizoctonia solani]
MILDAETPPKPPGSSRPTVRYTPAPSNSAYPQPVSYSTFPENQSTAHDSHCAECNSQHENRPLLHQHLPQSMHDDVEPPAYDEINPPSKSRKRFWLFVVLIVFVVCLSTSAWIFYKLNFVAGGSPPTKVPITRPTQPSNPTSDKGPSSLPTALPPPRTGKPDPTPPPHAPHPPSGRLPDRPFILPETGRTDLCSSWAYSGRLGDRRPGLRARGHPADQLAYTVPSLAPLHIEATSLCSTSQGSIIPCGSESTDRFASGALQVVAGDVKLPLVEIALVSTGDDQFQNLAICLMEAPHKAETGDGPINSGWALGIYELRTHPIPGRRGAPLQVSIVVTLPRGHTHNLSTSLSYFAQVVGPEVSMEPHALTFDTLQLRGGQGGGMDFLVRNVNAAVLRAESKVDNLRVDNSRISKLIHMRSENGIIGCNATLVQAGDSPPVRVDMKTTFGGISATTILDYSLATGIPRFEFDLHSEYNPTVGKILDPQGTDMISTGKFPQTLPIIKISSTSRYAFAQAVVPATYHGTMDIGSKYASIVTNDQANGIPGREVVWYESKTQSHRGAVRWNGRQGDRAGSINVFTEYATARILFLGLEDHNYGRWPHEGD